MEWQHRTDSDFKATAIALKSPPPSAASRESQVTDSNLRVIVNASRNLLCALLHLQKIHWWIKHCQNNCTCGTVLNPIAPFTSPVSSTGYTNPQWGPHFLPSGTRRQPAAEHGEGVCARTPGPDRHRKDQTASARPVF